MINTTAGKELKVIFDYLATKQCGKDVSLIRIRSKERSFAMRHGNSLVSDLVKNLIEDSVGVEESNDKEEKKDKTGN